MCVIFSRSVCSEGSRETFRFAVQFVTRFIKSTRQYFATRSEEIHVFSMIWSDVRLLWTNGMDANTAASVWYAFAVFHLRFQSTILFTKNQTGRKYHVFGNVTWKYHSKRWSSFAYYIHTKVLPCFLDKESRKQNVFIWSVRRDVHWSPIHDTPMVFWTYTCISTMV